MHMIPVVVADKSKAAIAIATEIMGSENELYPFSLVFSENHEKTQNLNFILGIPMVDFTSPGEDGSVGVRNSDTRFQKLSPTARGVTNSASDQELVYKKPETLFLAMLLLRSTT